MLANTGNVEISKGEILNPDEDCVLERLSSAMDLFTLSLLSTTRHHEQLSDFQVIILIGCITYYHIVCRHQVNKAHLLVGISPRGRELLTLLQDLNLRETKNIKVLLECQHLLKGRGGGKRLDTLIFK